MPILKRSAVLLLLAVIALAVRGRIARTSAADSEDITWGAIDPTWSPDSRTLAFSLFGSIWRVPADGGEAEQITTSPRYHAHPAWSPKGDRIAFIRGNVPAGRIPNISGTLALVDIATGQEREIRTPFPVAGTLAWSPDGSKLVCGLRGDTGNVLLHEIRVDGGEARQMHLMPQSARSTSPWIDVAWDAKHNEVFFTGERLSATQMATAPQIWSIKAGGPPIFVQLPITRYRREDIVQMDRISALPDGSGIVYSAEVVNGKGDYELYRVARAGGTPVNLTKSPRDEFAPAMSPDGRTIAHVSNHLGNIDLFTMPVAGGDKKHVRLTKLKFRNASGSVRVRVRDEQGNPTAVRLFVRASDGKAYCPPGVQIFYYSLDPGRRDGFFLATGEATFPVPAGGLELIALKGVEYEIAERKIEVAANETAEVTIQMQRWTNWLARGWYTGENHFHANYNGSYYQRPKQSMEWLQAEDLNAANMIVANSEGAFIHDKEFFRGAPDPLSTGRYILYWGQEYRNSFPLGHMAFLNIKKQVPPSYTSVIGSDSSYDFPLNTMAALEARKQGGLVSYVHPMGAVRDVFDTTLGAKEMPVGVALGAVDAIDILPFGEPAYDLWYRFLNCGVRISAGAGTDVFTNWRGINNIPGGARQYVEVGEAVTWQRWIDRFRQGRNFVTNGPLVEFTVNGQPPGSEIRVAAGEQHTARINARIVSRVPLNRVELIQNGRVIESSEVSGREPRMEKAVPVDGSCWFALRVTGPPARGINGGIPRAHTGAVFVNVGGNRVVVKEDVELMLRWIDRLWGLLEERNNFGPGKNRETARVMLDKARAYYRARL
jgi:TolB protein